MTTFLTLVSRGISGSRTAEKTVLVVVTVLALVTMAAVNLGGGCGQESNNPKA